MKMNITASGTVTMNRWPRRCVGKEPSSSAMAAMTKLRSKRKRSKEAMRRTGIMSTGLQMS